MPSTKFIENDNTGSNIVDVVLDYTVLVIDDSLEGIKKYTIDEAKLSTTDIIKQLGLLGFNVVEIGASDFNTVNNRSALEEKEVYNFRYILNTTDTDCNEAMISLADKTDSTALINIKADDDTATTSAIITSLKNKSSIGNLNKNDALFAGEVKYDTATKYPLSFHYLACLSNALYHNYPEYWAVAGRDRGVANKSVTWASYDFGENAVSVLAPRTIPEGESTFKHAVNCLKKTKYGYYLWSNRSAEELNTTGLNANHLLNIRQFINSAKAYFSEVTDRLRFNQNSDALWSVFYDYACNYLDEVKSNQGIRDYKVTKVTDTLLGQVKAKIKIVPIEAVEDFVIEFDLVNDIGE